MTVLPTIRRQLEEAAHRQSAATRGQRLGGARSPSLGVATRRAVLALGVAMPVALVLYAVAAGHRSAAPATRTPAHHRLATTMRLLNGGGLGTTSFGESPQIVATALSRRLGAPVGAAQAPAGYRPAVCGFSWQVWEGLGASSDGRLFVSELDAWYRDGRFAGYTYAANQGQTRLSSWRQYGPARIHLATTRGLAVGDSLERARRLYGKALTVSTAMQGTPPNPRLSRMRVWRASSPLGPLTGPLGAVALRSPTTAALASPQDTRIVAISAGLTPNTPCRAGRAP